MYICRRQFKLMTTGSQPHGARWPRFNCVQMIETMSYKKIVWANLYPCTEYHNGESKNTHSRLRNIWIQKKTYTDTTTRQWSGALSLRSNRTIFSSTWHQKL